MHTSPHLSHPGFEQVQREAFSRVFRRLLKLRVVLSPIPVVLVSISLLGDSAAWRVWLVAVAALITLLGIVVAFIWVRRKDFFLEAAGGSLLYLGVPFFAALCLASGGLESPMLQLVVPASFFTALLFPREKAIPLSGYLMVLIGGLAAISMTGAIPDLVPRIFGGGPRAGHSNALLIAATVVNLLMLVWGTLVGMVLRTIFRNMVQLALDARDDALKSHAESIQALTTLSGEIAHELKNPLASVKGLAAMIAREVEGRPAERLAVLRREVDRMQEILEGFLNFSRPLLPLNEQRVTLDGLCRQVAELHEGMAGERGVGVRVADGSSVEAWCDPRKVRQVIINLVQNALEAAPRGSAVELRVGATPDGGGRVEVLDRGPGLSEEVRARVFEPGVTTKQKGSGLGLAIARALTRQHGGELSLRAREGGGCVAELVLPPAPPVGVRTAEGVA